MEIRKYLIDNNMTIQDLANELDWSYNKLYRIIRIGTKLDVANLLELENKTKGALNACEMLFGKKYADTLRQEVNYPRLKPEA